MKFDDLIAIRAKAYAERLNSAAQSATKEEEIRIASERELQLIQDAAGIKLEGKHEFTVASGFVDSVYDRVLIEYKNPKSPSGKIGSKLDSPGTKKVIEQIKSRFRDLCLEHGQPLNSLFGVGLDGRYFVFIRYRDGEWQVQEPTPVTPFSAERFLWALFNLGTKGKPFSPSELAKDFGASAPFARLAIKSLYETLLKTEHPKSLVLFNQWKILFGEVCGYDVNTTSEKIKTLAKSYDISITGLKTAALLFSLHTYYALFMKLLASQIIAFDHGLPTPLSKMIQAPTGAKLKREIEDFEAGSIFRYFNITNFLEGDLFAWYLPEWNHAVEAWIRSLVSQLDAYNPGTMAEDPMESRDLLKKLYHQLFPEIVRHDLGEYYTPDWLAEHVLDQVKYSGNPDDRILDPACGSGTFLVMAIARIRRWYDLNRESIKYNEAELCRKILANVIGFDLNPLAVMAARTNYLIALRGLTSHVDSIEIPVYMCDSIMTPSEHGGLFAGELKKARELNTAGAIFIIPTEITHTQSDIARYAELLEMCVKNAYSPDEFIARAKEEDLSVQDILIHKDLYSVLLQLNSENKNGVWARIIKNAFAPLFTPRVDFVVGNPPWINWESLPDVYRKSTASLWLEYGLFRQKGYKAKLGGAKDDISILMTYVCHDIYLKDTGTLGFLITQSIFKTKGGGDGFRGLRYAPHGSLPKYLAPVRVEDLDTIQAFEGAKNRTAIFITGKAHSAIEYPVPYIRWIKNKRAKIHQDSSLKEVLSKVERRIQAATPVDKDDLRSPWITGSPQVLEVLSSLQQHTIGYESRKGVYCPTNTIYWIEKWQKGPANTTLITNLADSGKKKVKKVTVAVESDFLFRLVRGKDISRWNWESKYKIILPQDPNQPSKAMLESALKIKFPKTFDYFKQFESAIRKCALLAQFFNPEVDPFYSSYNVGAYTYAPFKVVWKEICTEIEAVIIASGKETIIPDHKLVLVSFHSAAPAYFLSGILNSSPIGLFVRSYTLQTSISGHIFDYVAIPEYSASDPLHRKVVILSKKCHKANASGQTGQIDDLEEELDQVAAEVLKIPTAKLTVIRDELQLLRGIAPPSSDPEDED
jgi:SAM-dependent methyltransferase